MVDLLGLWDDEECFVASCEPMKSGEEGYGTGETCMLPCLLIVVRFGAKTNQPFRPTATRKPFSLGIVRRRPSSLSRSTGTCRWRRRYGLCGTWTNSSTSTHLVTTRLHNTNVATGLDNSIIDTIEMARKKKSHHNREVWHKDKQVRDIQPPYL